MRKILLSLLLASLIFTCGFTKDLESKAINANKKLILNPYDGYSIELPKNAKASVNENYYKTNIDYGNTNIKIYMQDISKKLSYQEYRNYSLLGIKNNQNDHKITGEQGLKINGKEGYKISYERRKLSKIENDKNYYQAIFLKVSDSNCLSFIVKSSEPIKDQEILNIVKTYKPIKKKTQAINKVENFNTYENESLVSKRDISDESKKVYVDTFLTEGTKWGVFVNSFWNNVYEQNFSNHIGYNFKYMILYHDFNQPNYNISMALDYCKNRNKYLELTFQTNMKDGRNETYDLLDGKYEDRIRDMAKKVAEKKHTSIFRIANEMNGDWCAYSSYNTGLDADIYLAMYDYIYNIFEEEGANKYILYVFNPNGRNFPNFKYNDESVYRPDPQRYDLLGLTLYNTGNYYEGEKWESFEELYDDLYKRSLDNYDKPFMITEFACSTIGGDKTSWVKDMFEKMPKYPRIKLAIWFSGVDLDKDNNPARTYKIDDPKEILDIFKLYLQGK